LRGTEGVALGEESLDETLAALAQRHGALTGRRPMHAEIGYVPITANKEHLALLDR
jgi:hypothetical protein